MSANHHGPLGLAWITLSPVLRAELGAYTPERVPALVVGDLFVPLHAAGSLATAPFYPLSGCQLRGLERAAITCAQGLRRVVRPDGSLTVTTATALQRDARTVCIPALYLSKSLAFQAGFLLESLEHAAA